MIRHLIKLSKFFCLAQAPKFSAVAVLALTLTAMGCQKVDTRKLFRRGGKGGGGVVTPAAPPPFDPGTQQLAPPTEGGDPLAHEPHIQPPHLPPVDESDVRIENGDFQPGIDPSRIRVDPQQQQATHLPQHEGESIVGGFEDGQAKRILVDCGAGSECEKKTQPRPPRNKPINKPIEERVVRQLPKPETPRAECSKEGNDCRVISKPQPAPTKVFAGAEEHRPPTEQAKGSRHQTPRAKSNDEAMDTSGFIPPYRPPLNEQACEPFDLCRKGPELKQLDILFVFDTSASIRTELPKIAGQMEQFMRGLNPGVDDINIGIILGHGQNASSGLHGKLYQYDSNDPLVIKLKDLTDERYELYSKHNKGAKSVSRINSQQAARRIIWQQLETKIEQLKKVNDRSSAQGEVGLLSLYHAVTSNRADLQREGMLRDSAALAVIMVADENDACFDYSKRKELTPRLNHNGHRRPEEETFAGECRQVRGSSRLTEKLVYNALKELKGEKPLILSGILYKDQNLLPKSKSSNSDVDWMENEVGHGYLDLIELSGGQAVELAGFNFGQALARIGDYTGFMMECEHVIPFQTEVRPSSINSNCVRVEVVSGRGEVLGDFRTSCGLDVPVPEKDCACPAGAKPAVFKIDGIEMGFSPEQAQVLINFSDLKNFPKDAKAIVHFRPMDKAPGSP